jgi:hypothetical protein
MRALMLFPLLTATVVRFTGCPLVPSSPPDDNTPTPPQRVTLTDGFENGLVNWVQDGDLPDDPGNPGHPVAASVVLSTEQAFEGARSAKFTLDGTQGDGTVWLEHQFSLLPDQNYRVTLSFAFWSAALSDNLLANVAAFGGTERPRREEDFDLTQSANQTVGWKQHNYTFDLTTDATGRIWVALGVNAVFETQLTYFIDDVRITIDPR